jgi:hypothetical protein
LHWNAWVRITLNKSLYCNTCRQTADCIAVHLNACFFGTRCHQKCHLSVQLVPSNGRSIRDRNLQTGRASLIAIAARYSPLSPRNALPVVDRTAGTASGVCKLGQQIPKQCITRSITRDVVAPDRQTGHADSEISAARDERLNRVGSRRTRCSWSAAPCPAGAGQIYLTSLAKLSPYDLLRSCDNLCRKAGGDLK